MDGWSQDQDEMVVGRRMKVGRRRTPTPGLRWIVIGVITVVVAGAAFGGYLLFRPEGLAALPDQAVVAPGGYRASIGANNTITVGLEIRNTADVPVTIVSTRIVAPAGLTSTSIAVVPTGDGNQGFSLEGELPKSNYVELGIEAIERNAIIAARFTVDCAGLLADEDPHGEQIFVTIQVGTEQRTEELTPPVVGDLPWLAASARRVCLDPVPTGTPEGPLPPDVTAGATP